MPRAVVLLSGGLDSYTAAAIAQSEGFTLDALSILYGQRHAQELEAARRVAKALGVERHLELPLDLRAIGGSSLTSDLPVPEDRDLAATDIPSTYVPARNTVFLALALGWAEVLGATIRGIRSAAPSSSPRSKRSPTSRRARASKGRGSASIHRSFTCRRPTSSAGGWCWALITA